VPLSFLADDRTDFVDAHEAIDPLLIVCRQVMMASFHSRRFNRVSTRVYIESSDMAKTANKDMDARVSFSLWNRCASVWIALAVQRQGTKIKRQGNNTVFTE